MIMHLTAMFLFFIGRLSTSVQSELQKPNVGFYYESRCPYCILYITRQLVPVVKQFTSNIHIDLVPYGNTAQSYHDGHWRFDCQHGKDECHGNKLHACAILEACGRKSSALCRPDKLEQVMDYIYCEVDESDKSVANDKCAKEAGLCAECIAMCAISEEGEILENYHGNRTSSLDPPHTYVPYVTINHMHNRTAENNLHKLICKMRPDLCTGAYTKLENDTNEHQEC